MSHQSSRHAFICNLIRSIDQLITAAEPRFYLSNKFMYCHVPALDRWIIHQNNIFICQIQIDITQYIDQNIEMRYMAKLRSQAHFHSLPI